jgi:hypothetical protein
LIAGVRSPSASDQYLPLPSSSTAFWMFTASTPSGLLKTAALWSSLRSLPPSWYRNCEKWKLFGRIAVR